MTKPVNISGSLRTRMSLTLICGALVLALLLFWIVRNYAFQIAQRGQDTILSAAVTSMLDTALIRNGQIEMDFPYGTFAMLNTKADDRVFYTIYQDRDILSGYDTLARPSFDQLDQMANGTPIYYSSQMDQAPIRVAAASRVLIGEQARITVTIAIAQTQEDLRGTLTAISENTAAFGAGFFGLAMLLSIWATASTIRPLQRLTNSMTRRGPKDLKPVEAPVVSEMAPLVSSLNRLMERLATSLQQSEDFIAEAAHRVRTPLAIVRSHAEATLQRVNQVENRQAMRSMLRAIAESSRAAGQLLDHAMITFRADHLECQDVDLPALIRDLIQGLSPVAEMKDISLNLQIETAATVSADPILLQNAIRNLLDNALKYSPPETEISIRIHGHAPVTLDICDQGPGFPPDQMDHLLGRFSRGDNAGESIGSGLGLTIAYDVALAHGGALTLSNNDGGGACVSFSL
jgi:two-component system sensor histidine kinase TctE